MRFTCLVIVGDGFQIPNKKVLGKKKVDFKKLHTKLRRHLKKFDVENESLSQPVIFKSVLEIKQDQLDLIQRVNQKKYLDKLGLCQMNLREFALHYYNHTSEEDLDEEGNIFYMKNPHGMFYNFDIGMFIDKPILASSLGKDCDVISVSEFDYEKTLKNFQEVFPEESLDSFFTVGVVTKGLEYFEMPDNNPEEWQRTFQERFLQTLDPSDQLIFLDMRV